MNYKPYFLSLGAAVPLFEMPLVEGPGVIMGCFVILEMALHDSCILNRKTPP